MCMRVRVRAVAGCARCLREVFPDADGLLFCGCPESTRPPGQSADYAADSAAARPFPWLYRDLALTLQDARTGEACTCVVAHAGMSRVAVRSLHGHAQSPSEDMMTGRCNAVCICISYYSACLLCAAIFHSFAHRRSTLVRRHHCPALPGAELQPQS